jgi:hypothetical protein
MQSTIPYRQMMVNDFLVKHVPGQYGLKFLELMRKFDGSGKRIGTAFYDIDILSQILDEAKKMKKSEKKT